MAPARKTNGEIVAKPKAAAKGKKVAPVKAAEAEKPNKGKKRALEEDEDDTDEDMNKAEPAKPAKKVKTAPAKKAAPQKAAAAPKKAPAAKKAAAPKKAVAKKPAVVKAKSPTPGPAPESSDKGEDEEDDDVEVVPTKTSPAPEEVAKPAPKEKTHVNHAHVKVSPKIPQHKIGVKINELPTQRLDIYVFGEGSSGELGLGSKKDENDRAPIDVKRPRLNPNLANSTVGIVKVAVGGMHCAAISHDNKIYTWGVNDQGALGRDTTWDGGVRDMDDDDSDSGEMNPLESTPTVVDSKWFPVDVKFTDICASDSATFVVTEDGRVYGWGTFRNNEGILGFSQTVEVQYRPVLIPELTKITKMVAGGNHILALNNKGKVYAWGTGQQNQLGRRVVERNSLAGLVPREFGLRGQISHIACGAYHSFAVDSKGTVYAWGLNSFGECGVDFDEDEPNLPKPTIVKVLQDKEIVAIDGGAHHSIALTQSGDVYSWGRCDGGQSGTDPSDIDKDNLLIDDNGKIKTILIPTKVDEFDDEPVTFVSAANDNSYAITKDGKPYSWGFSGNYQTGQGTDDDVETATQIDNTAVRDKTILAAYGGGQFGILTGVPKGKQAE